MSALKIAKENQGNVKENHCFVNCVCVDCNYKRWKIPLENSAKKYF